MVGLADTDDVGVDGIEEDAEAAANEKFALAGDVIGETDAGGDAVVVGGDERGENAFVTGEAKAADCGGEDGRLNARDEGRGLAVGFEPLEGKFVAEAEVDGELCGHAPVVLNVGEDAVLNAALDEAVLRLNGVGEAEDAVGKTDAGVGGAEGDGTGIVLAGEVLEAEVGEATLDGVIALGPGHAFVELDVFVDVILIALAGAAEGELIGEVEGGKSGDAGQDEVAAEVGEGAAFGGKLCALEALVAKAEDG